MALSPHDTTELPCGRPLGPLVEQVSESRPPADPEHQASCPYCRAALVELDALWSGVGDLARERVEVPPGLVAAVMRRIVKRRSGDHALLPSPLGATRIADVVVEAVAGRAAAAVAGVRLSGRDSVEVRLDGARVALVLELIVDLGRSLPPLTAAVRAAVIADVEALTGLAVRAVDVAVADVADD